MTFGHRKIGTMNIFSVFGGDFCTWHQVVLFFSVKDSETYVNV